MLIRQFRTRLGVKPTRGLVELSPSSSSSVTQQEGNPACSRRSPGAPTYPGRPAESTSPCSDTRTNPGGVQPPFQLRRRKRSYGTGSDDTLLMQPSPEVHHRITCENRCVDNVSSKTRRTSGSHGRATRFYLHLSRDAQNFRPSEDFYNWCKYLDVDDSKARQAPSPLPRAGPLKRCSKETRPSNPHWPTVHPQTAVHIPVSTWGSFCS